MDREQVRTVVQNLLAVQSRLAKKTRTHADDLLFGILRANESRLVEAVHKLVCSPDQPPTEQQVVDALESVGIKV